MSDRLRTEYSTGKYVVRPSIFGGFIIAQRVGKMGERFKQSTRSKTAAIRVADLLTEIDKTLEADHGRV